MQFSTLFLGLLSSGSLAMAAVVASDKTQLDPRSPDYQDLAKRIVSRPLDCEHGDIYEMCVMDNPGTCGNIHPIAAMTW